MLLDHGTPCLGYSVREEDRRNVDAVALGEMGLRPGPWLRAIKDPEVSGGHRVELDGRTLSVYLTDFFIESEAAEDRLVAFLEGCGTLVCEANHRLADSELAARNYHMTSDDVGRLAARVGPAHLVLFHLSNRYTTEQWTEQLREVQVWFPGAAFPPGWEW